MIFDINTKLSKLLAHEKAAEIFDRILPGLSAMAKSNPQAGQLSAEQIVRYTRVPNGEQVLARLQEALGELNTGEIYISPEEQALIQRFRRIAGQERAPARPHRQDAIYPGQPWLDTNGRRIQAHGGAVIHVDGVYYWYGENKEYTDGKNGVWTWGIRAYSSRDLCNWEDRGLIIPPDIENPNSPLFPAKRVDRPHILKCPKTGKFVCWIKLSGPEAAFTVWQAEDLLGPYEMVEALCNPGGYKVGDFDLVADEATGKGYLYFDGNHKAMVCMALTEDYLHAEAECMRSYADLNPPFTREAPCLFPAFGKKYMITSGMTGYVPNRSDWAVADAWENEFISQGDPHVADDSRASFNAQIAKIFPVAGKENRFIAMADRWLPEEPVDARVADLFTRVIGSTYAPERYSATEEERREMYARNKLENAHTAISDYVWLPITWENQMPRIHWMDAWDPAEL